MRFVFNDPYTLRGAVHELAGSEPVATRERDLPVPVDVYQLDNETVIEGAIPGARLEDLDLSCEDGLLTVQGEVERATASFENGVVRITIPRRHQRVVHPIKVQIAATSERSRIAKDKSDVIEAVKGRGYREVALKSYQRRGRQK